MENAVTSELSNFLSGAGGAAVFAGIFALIKTVIEHCSGRKKKDAEERKREAESQKQELQDIRADMQLLKAAQCVSMQDRISYLITCFIRDGYISTGNRNMIFSMHEKYHDLGGNGALTAMLDEVRKLPTKTD